MDQTEMNDTFFEELNSDLHIVTDYDSKKFDYTWIDIYEDVIPYIDNILRNPKRFIINEEEVVKVELSKKVTVESIIHLSQHTNLIQDYDEKKGDVKPSKILNINKDESLDTYENRFIFTLLNNMRLFYDQHAPQTGGESYFKDQKTAQYEANTKIGTEDIKISLFLESVNQQKSEENNGKMSIEDRLKKIKLQMDGFEGSELYQTLSHLHIAAVRSPIRKTNVILKNPNFRKAEELWNFLQRYNQQDSVVEKSHSDVHDVGDIKNQFDQSFLLDYLAINKLSKKKDKVSQKKAISLALSRVIENILEIDDQILEEKMRRIFKEEFRSAKANFDKRNEKIVKVFEDRLERMNRTIEEACSYLN